MEFYCRSTFPQKKTDWQPALDRGLPAKQCRHLNQVADAAAGAAVEVTEILKEDERGINMKSQAHQWAQQVVDRQHNVTLPFHQNLVQIMQLADS